MADTPYEALIAHLLPARRFGIVLGLDRMRALLDRLGAPDRALGTIVHVGGTNGKGSTVAMIAALAVLGVVLIAAITVALMGGDGGETAAKGPTPPPPDRPIVRRSFLEEVIPGRGGGLPGADVPARIAAMNRW